ncbi:MAG: alpha-E domain-containing protein [Deltaproteobacteria bacterium]|nr:alpha-E domain-containing protein [Deltaproteobacteria bacterium]
MLSRAAEQMFWMGRYVERACNVARLLEVNYYLSLDWEDQYVQWEPLVQITGDYEFFLAQRGQFDAPTVMQFLLLDNNYQNSAICALSNARENARASREYLPIEFWEELNRAFQLLKKYAAYSEISLATMQRLCGKVTETGVRLQGICEDYMWHGEGYQFFRLGVWLERSDKTSRFLHAKYFYLLPDSKDVGSTLDDLHWAALLHSLAGLDIYHRQYGLVTPDKVISFLVLDERFPRSIRFCLQQALICLSAIVSPEGTKLSNENCQSAAQLEQLLKYVTERDGAQIVINGLHEFINDFQIRLNHTAEGIQLDFF